METISIEKLQQTCRMDPEEMEKFEDEGDSGWLYVALAKYANQFDDYSESMVDGIMCTATCPCYGDPNQKTKQHPEGKEEVKDGFTHYA